MHVHKGNRHHDRPHRLSYIERESALCSYWRIVINDEPIYTLYQLQSTSKCSEDARLRLLGSHIIYARRFVSKKESLRCVLLMLDCRSTYDSSIYTTVVADIPKKND